MGRVIALLRGINVGGHRKVPMADLRVLAADLELGNPASYIASGNLVFDSAEAPAVLEEKIEHALRSRFGFSVDVIVRTSAQWSEYAASNPFIEESRIAANFVMLVIGKQAPDDEVIEWLRTRASTDERVEPRGDALWIWFPNGSGRSKIGPGPSRGVWTSRNWNTVLKLKEMLGA